MLKVAGVTTIAAIVTATALAATGAVPSRLLGTYTRTIPAKALARTGFPQGAGTWSITFEKNSTAFIQGPAGISSYQKLTATAGALTLRDEFCAPHNRGGYRWRLAGKTLKLTNASDRCYDRATIVTGSWKRK